MFNGQCRDKCRSPKVTLCVTSGKLLNLSEMPVPKLVAILASLTCGLQGLTNYDLWAKSGLTVCVVQSGNKEWFSHFEIVEKKKEEEEENDIDDGEEKKRLHVT